jgi:hypothetical protein
MTGVDVVAAGAAVTIATWPAAFFVAILILVLWVVLDG